MPVRMSVCMSTRMPVRFPVRLPVRLPVRMSVRMSGVAAAVGLLTASLALAGCGGGGGGSDTSEPSGTPTASTAGTGAASLSSLEGSWSGKTDGRPVALSVTGTLAVVVAGGQVCTGQVTDAGASSSGKPTLTLTCASGGSERTAGTVESNDGETLVLAWEAGTRDTLVKTDPGELDDAKLPDGTPLNTPTGIPTP